MGTTGTNRARTSAFHYQPYGAYDYAAGSHSSNADNFLGFQGGFFHSNAGYTKFGHRWYNAGIGSFTQPDPIGTPGSSGSEQENRSGIGGPYSAEGNYYGFAGGNPCNNSDPTGLYIEPKGNACDVLGFFSTVAAGAGYVSSYAGAGVLGRGFGAVSAGFAGFERFCNMLPKKGQGPFGI